ncbi:hypothetical protein P152DRAFT_425626 [Eremomyces bilateralis CBS 781.70]|uniref:Pyruvate carboxylase n=1 Tax=Eremomyces bilateralis CBS 781.70 TaxID=1392243 RepID=A0A6G1FQP3_9PEZI|nr:uncharacterized protein P152DRAFT_425626 [Eremomyces bilateralis CBS 781.70]KAF1808009.1 hypothetical protein P152DRAFT_425626 [Eremomyces bilateralis CBS 781.70]
MSSRPFKNLLVANRGEIATRIISSARELELETFAIYSGEDNSHTVGADHALKLASPASYLDIAEIIGIVKSHGIEAVHPGYGFLSESAEFARRVEQETGAFVIGPGAQILLRTGDKLEAKKLAAACNVPTLPALTTPTNSIQVLQKFASQCGYPIMVKAVDGGGGRGIRLIRSEEELESSARRAIEESPSKQVFAERAAVDGYRHIEIQIVGDGNGDVRHLWERECSIQRRYQKVVEIAPSSITDRALVARVIESAVSMARSINYRSLGTFEFLANPQTKEFFFLEVNPRLQVEHTITESITSHDIVKLQLRLAHGARISELMSQTTQNPAEPPALRSVQLRITAENVQNDWSLSIGKISSFHFPSGNGIRVDTNLISGHSAMVSTDFDSLLAKIIVTALSWEDVVAKAKRALVDTRIEGVKTNLDVLKGIVSHPSFLAGKCDTRWLEATQVELLQTGESITARAPRTFQVLADSSSQGASFGQTSVLFRKGDAWSLTLAPRDDPNASVTNHLQLIKVLRNEFPTAMTAEIMYTPSGATKPTPYKLALQSTTASAGSTTSTQRKGNPKNPAHIIIPFPGKLVEVLVDEGDIVKEGDVVCVVQQMKMELEVRAHRTGRITWVTEAEDGEEVAEGTLAAEVEGEGPRVEAKL